MEKAGEEVEEDQEKDQQQSDWNSGTGKTQGNLETPITYACSEFTKGNLQKGRWEAVASEYLLLLWICIQASREETGGHC